MMAAYFFDSNVFLYAAMRGLKPHERHKRPAAQALIEQHDFVVSTQVLAEFYDNIRRKWPAPFSHDEAMEWIELIRVRPCLPVDENVVVTGAMLAERYQIRYWDGAILAAAHELGAGTVFSEDLNDGQRYGDVTVINPFKPQAN
jgi:predicted nucleic acid-binding protein